MSKCATLSEAGCKAELEEIIEENAELIRKGRQREIKFPQIRRLFNAELICTFSHLTPNLPFDEIYSNFMLLKIIERAGLRRESVWNLAYDNYIPENDTPKAYTIQYGIVSPKILEPDIIPSLQNKLRYERDVLFKDGQNRVKSAPEQNIEKFRERFDQLDEIFQRHAGEGNVVERLLAIRREFFELIGLDVIPEQPCSKYLRTLAVDVLEILYKNGFPFWEMPVPEDKYSKQTFLVEGIDAHRKRKPVRLKEGAFVFDYDAGKEKRIPKEEIFEALRAMEVIPTMPLVILTLVTAPQMSHLGGGVWKQYAPKHVEAQAQWLGIPERSDTLILATRGKTLLKAYRHNEEFIGFPVIYMTYGKEMIRRALEEGLQLRVEFKRVVY